MKEIKLLWLFIIVFINPFSTSMAHGMEESGSGIAIYEKTPHEGDGDKNKKDNTLTLEEDYIKKDFVQAKQEFLMQWETVWKNSSPSNVNKEDPKWDTEHEVFKKYKEKGFDFLFPRKLRQVPSGDDSTRTQQGHESAAVGDTIYRTNPIIEHMLEDAGKGKLFLDVGSSYGVNTFKLLEKGAMVIANDSDPESLIRLAQRSKGKGWDSRLFIVKGYFPKDINIEENSLDGILMSYVIHYLNPKEIQEVFKAAYRLLKPGGKLYITSLSPYAENFAWFTAESLKRFIDKDPWPSEIKDQRDLWRQLTQLFPERLPTELPNYMHPQYPEIMAREAKKANFEIEKATYYSFSPISTLTKMKQDSLRSYRFYKDGSGLIAVKGKESLKNTSTFPTSDRATVEIENDKDLTKVFKNWAVHQKDRKTPNDSELSRLDLDKTYEGFSPFILTPSDDETSDDDTSDTDINDSASDISESDTSSSSNDEEKDSNITSDGYDKMFSNDVEDSELVTKLDDTDDYEKEEDDPIWNKSDD